MIKHMAYLGMRRRIKEPVREHRIIQGNEDSFAMIVWAAQHKIDHPEMYVKKEVQICPSCNKGNLMERAGKFGDFMGCTEYPKCKYTEKIAPKFSQPYRD